MPLRITQFRDAVLVVLLIGCSAYIGATAFHRSPAAAATREAAVPRELLSIDGAQFIGDPEATAVLVEYSDFQCPYCIQFTKYVWPRLKSAYVDTGRLRLAFVHFPLDELHPRARAAATAVDCAAREGRFWQLHDVLFAEPGDFSAADLAARASTAGVTDSAFESCMDAGLSASRQAAIEAAVQAGVTGTPTFFAGRLERDGRVQVVERLSGARPFEDFVAVIDKLSVPPIAVARGGQR